LCKDVGVDLTRINEYASDDLENADVLQSTKEDGYVIVFNIKWSSKENTEDIENVNIRTHCDFIDDLKTNEEVKVIPESEKTLEEIDPKECIYLDYGVVYHSKGDKFFSYLLNKSKYLSIENQGAQGILNMMRRHRSRELVLEPIKLLIKRGTSLSKLSKLFEKLNEGIKFINAKRPSNKVVNNAHKVNRITEVIPMIRSAEPSNIKIYLSQTPDTSLVVFQFSLKYRKDA